ncbi:hypothetical protein [Chroococcidiopsis sp.]
MRGEERGVTGEGERTRGTGKQRSRGAEEQRRIITNSDFRLPTPGK